MKLRARLLAAFAVVIAFPLAIALLLVDASLQDELLVFGITVLLGIGAAVILAPAFARPVEDLTDAAARMVAGDLGPMVTVNGDDEIGRLGRALVHLQSSLQQQVVNVESSRDEVRNSVRRLGEALRSTHDLRKMLSVVLETALVAVRGKSGAVYLLSAKRSELYVKVGRHLSANIARERIPLGQGLAGWVAEHREGARAPAVEGKAVPADPEPIEQTALAVPLESQSQLLGVIALYGRQSGEPYNDEDLEVIHSLARQAGIGIENVLLHDEAKRLSITDGLTGIWNYRYFQMRLAQEFERAIRFGRPLSLVLIDLDHFKSINDRFGHQRGDSILIELANRVVSDVRLQIDVFARYGGEEFVLLLPETDRAGARIASEKIRADVAARPFGGPDEAEVPVTVSVGYAVYPDDGATAQLLLQGADKAMYGAKASGRNRVMGIEELSNGPSLARDPAHP